MIIVLLFLLSIFAPVIAFYLTGKRRGKVMLFANIICFAGTFIFASVYMFSSVSATSTSSTSDLSVGLGFIAAALVTGLGAIGTGIAVSNTAAAAIGAISENENNFGKAMIFVAMAEGIAIYGLLISFMILGRI